MWKRALFSQCHQQQCGKNLKGDFQVNLLLNLFCSVLLQIAQILMRWLFQEPSHQDLWSLQIYDKLLLVTNGLAFCMQNGSNGYNNFTTYLQPAEHIFHKQKFPNGFLIFQETMYSDQSFESAQWVKWNMWSQYTVSGEIQKLGFTKH